MNTSRGFTLLELVLVLATATVLALLAAGSYRVYLVRAQAAQGLVDVDQITTVVRVENRLDNPDLEVGATAGAAPPKLKGTIPDRAFRGRNGITFTMIKAPAGTFTSYPDKTTYALVATASSEAASDIAALRWGLSRAAGDMPWLDAQSFVFPIEPIAVADPATTPPGTGGGSTGGSTEGGGSVPPDNLPACNPNKGEAKGKDFCWCRKPDGTKVKEAC